MDNGKVALITGASKGIGAETARLLSKEYEIIVNYNSSQKDAEAVADSIISGGGKARLIQADVSTEAGCRTLFEFVSENYDHLDVLVNNAGAMVAQKTVEDLDWHYLEKVFELNVYSVMMLSHLCLPLLRKGVKPCIINLSSIAMRHGAPRAPVYGGAKSAVDSFSRGLAGYLGPDIRVNAVAPGVIDTPFHDEVTPPEVRKTMIEKTPLKALGKAEDVASAIEFLIKNEFITGETIDVNGGLYVR